jgi:hypothetical protein
MMQDRKDAVGRRSSTRIGVNSESRENIYIKHKRAHGVALLNYEPRRCPETGCLTANRLNPWISWKTNSDCGRSW